MKSPQATEGTEDFLARWLPYCSKLAARLAPLLRPYGWDRDDATQHAALKLLRVRGSDRVRAMTDECLIRYLPRIVKRSLLRAARSPKNLYLSASDVLLAAAEDRGADWVAAVVTEVIGDAPPGVREYFRVVVVEGRTWPQTRHREARKAARWIELQLSRA